MAKEEVKNTPVEVEEAVTPDTTKAKKGTLQSFSFPEYGQTIQAESIEEAQKILFSNIK